MQNKIKINLKKTLTRVFFNYILFLIKIPPIAKIRFRIYCICFEILSTNIKRKFLFFKGFRQFLCEFSIFLKTVFSVVIPIKRDRLLCIEQCAQCLKYKADDDYICKIGTKRTKVKMRNLLLNYLRYGYWDQIIFYKDCNRIKGFFD